MDKRFFLALLLSLVVVAISQVLFPSAAKKPTTPVTQTGAPIADSVGRVDVAAPARSVDSTRDSSHVATTETRSTITTDKAIYTFTNIGASPVSLVMKDYANRSPSGGKVDLAVPGTRLLTYKLVVGVDTVPLE